MQNALLPEVHCQTPPSTASTESAGLPTAALISGVLPQKHLRWVGLGLGRTYPTLTEQLIKAAQTINIRWSSRDRSNPVRPEPHATGFNPRSVYSTQLGDINEV